MMRPVQCMFTLALCALLTMTACTASRSSQPAPEQSRTAQQPGLAAAPRPQAAGGTAPNRPQAHAATPQLHSGSESATRKNVPLSLTDLHQKYRSTFLFSGPSWKRQAALTFDDVPDNRFTPMVLDVLKKYGVHATFFVVGNRAEAHPDMIKRIIAEGHVIGTHSYSHPNLIKMDDARFRDEILRTEKLLGDMIGYTPRLFRPPYGNVNEQQILWLASQKNYIINWNVDSLDWKGLSGDQVAANVLGHIVPGCVILQHAGGGAGEDLTGTIEALPRIIEQLQGQNIQLVTVPELFDIPKEK